MEKSGEHVCLHEANPPPACRVHGFDLEGLGFSFCPSPLPDCANSLSAVRLAVPKIFSAQKDSDRLPSNMLQP